MTNQLQGEILFKGLSPGNDEWVYTPWITVRGDIATFAVEVTAINGTDLTWNVETRTAEDPATIIRLFGTNQTASSVDIHKATATVKAKQQIRYLMATQSGVDAAKWVRCRALAPSWQADR